MPLRAFSALRGFSIQASDGKIGCVTDLFIDERNWTVRHLVVHLSHGWTRREVLLKTDILGEVDWEKKTIQTNRSRSDIQRDTHPSSAETVSSFHSDEVDESMFDSLMLIHGGTHIASFPMCYGGLDAWRYLKNETQRMVASVDNQVNRLPAKAEFRRSKTGNLLRSAEEITGYFIDALDGPAGYLADLMVSPQSGNWQISQLVIHSRWFWSSKTLSQPEFVNEISWEDQTIRIDRTRRQIHEGSRTGGNNSTGVN